MYNANAGCAMSKMCSQCAKDDTQLVVHSDEASAGGQNSCEASCITASLLDQVSTKSTKNYFFASCITAWSNFNKTAQVYFSIRTLILRLTWTPTTLFKISNEISKVQKRLVRVLPNMGNGWFLVLNSQFWWGWLYSFLVIFISWDWRDFVKLNSKAFLGEILSSIFFHHNCHMAWCWCKCQGCEEVSSSWILQCGSQVQWSLWHVGQSGGRSPSPWMWWGQIRQEGKQIFKK